MKLKITILSLLIAASIIVLVVVKRAEAAADWIGIDSTHYDSHCGDNGQETIEEALDGTDEWRHLVNETHWFIIDLGQEYSIQKVRGRSDRPFDPIDVNIYVSNDKASWGAAVASGINTWQDTTNWADVDNTDKNGRYVKVEIVDTESSGFIYFGGPDPSHFKIFDVYGEATGAATAAQAIIVTME